MKHKPILPVIRKDAVNAGPAQGVGELCPGTRSRDLPYLKTTKTQTKTKSNFTLLLTLNWLRRSPGRIDLMSRFKRVLFS